MSIPLITKRKRCKKSSSLRPALLDNGENRHHENPGVNVLLGQNLYRLEAVRDEGRTRFQYLSQSVIGCGYGKADGREKPAPPLGYKIVFGGREMPLRERDARVVKNSELVPVPRYSGAEAVFFTGVGEGEAWHEGFMPWLMDLQALKGLKLGTQMTCRWPGYAAKVTMLKEIGLLGQELVDVDGVPVVPKKFLDALLYPQVGRA